MTQHLTLKTFNSFRNLQSLDTVYAKAVDIIDMELTEFYDWNGEFPMSCKENPKSLS